MKLVRQKFVMNDSLNQTIYQDVDKHYLSTTWLNDLSGFYSSEIIWMKSSCNRPQEGDRLLNVIFKLFYLCIYKYIYDNYIIYGTSLNPLSLTAPSQQGFLGGQLDVVSSRAPCYRLLHFFHSHEALRTFLHLGALSS